MLFTEVKFVIVSLFHVLIAERSRYNVIDLLLKVIQEIYVKIRTLSLVKLAKKILYRYHKLHLSIRTPPHRLP